MPPEKRLYVENTIPAVTAAAWRLALRAYRFPLRALCESLVTFECDARRRPMSWLVYSLRPACVLVHQTVFRSAPKLG